MKKKITSHKGCRSAQSVLRRLRQAAQTRRGRERGEDENRKKNKGEEEEERGSDLP